MVQIVEYGKSYYSSVIPALYTVQMWGGPGEETIHNFLFDCPMHEHAGFSLGHMLGWLSKSLWYILGS